jgi:cytochrome c nitrite reductase small subunit
MLRWERGEAGFAAAVVLSLAIGAAIGVGSYTFVVARGASYLTDNPESCANCHIMRDQFEGWLRSSHTAVAVCNDCHTPHTFAGKWTAKATNGFWHSFAFTTGRYPEPIRITGRNRTITEQTCRNCHSAVVAAMVGVHAKNGAVSCIRCHDGVGHMR